jgi:TPR repeat protein
VFAYYAKLKLSEKAMKYLFSAAPNELALVTVDKAIELGLRPEVWPKPKQPGVEPEKEPERAAIKGDSGGACDTYAASDDDPERKGAGISFDKIDAGLAVPACETAVQQYPESSRLNFQLGRAYQKANHLDAAITRYRKAADRGFAPAQASLGAVYETGQAGLRDYDEATKWYHLAAKQGDALGKAGLDRLVGASANGRALSQAIHEIDEIKGKIVDARTVQQTFSGLKYCTELNNTSFYSPLHDRIFNVEEYFRSLQNLVKVEHYDAAKHRALTLEDAKERLEKAKLKAQEDRHKCELVQSLPKLETRLQELHATAEKKQ